jgi:CRISPR-associated protein Csb3
MTMNGFTLAGPVTTALTHFALYGLSAIIENETGKSVRLCWTEESNPKPQLDAGLEPAEIAAAVHRHATRCASPQSWLSARVDYGHKATAVFSPRIATPSTPSAWRQLREARHNGLDAARGGELDLRMIGALGEQAYWPTGRNADAGASRWEMKTRQGLKGEFVGGRLILLGQHVAARTPDGILSGLTGHTVDDEAGGNKPESRSGTGFTRPGPVDNALAWCALWGISQFPLVHHNGSQSGTAGTHVPARRAYPTFVFLPVPTRPVTLARLRTILASRQLAVAATTTDTADPLDVIAANAARKWLNQRSIRALMKFPVRVSDNKSAPERQVLDGSVVAFNDPASLWT